MPKQRSPDDVHDIWNVEVGKPYRGSIVEKIDIETTNLPSGKVKVRRLIHCDTGIILIEDTWHEKGEVYDDDGKLLPYHEINFPSMDPADFAAPVRKKDDDDDEEKKKKRELLRQKAKDMLNNKDPNKTKPSKKDNDNDDMKIQVKSPAGRILPVVTKPKNTVRDLKEKLAKDHGIPVKEQNLSLDDETLDDPNATMKDCGVKPGDTIDMTLTPMTIFVHTPEGEQLKISVIPIDNVRDIKEKLESDHGVPIGDDQKLTFEGQYLDDPSATMKDCGIEDGDVLYLEPDCIAVTVKTPDGMKHRFNVLPSDTVRDLKETIERDIDIPYRDQNLSFNGEPLDDPDSTMEDNGIQDEDVIEMNADDSSDDDDDDDDGMTVNVCTPDGKSYAIPVTNDSTVRDVKKQVEADHGIPVKDQNLTYKGKPLDDPRATMEDLGVDDGDTLHLEDPKPKKKNKTVDYGDDSYPKAKDRTRRLNPDSAWVYPTPASAPRDGEIDNLQGIWSTPPEKQAGTDPVEVNIYPLHKEPKSDGKSDIHGAYGYVNGAQPDENGVVDPANVIFYPPGAKDYRPDFDQAGWWSAPESSSKTTVSWKFKGMDCYNVKKHTVNVMGHEMTFVKEWVE